jgi:hypothetical protein
VTVMFTVSVPFSFFAAIPLTIVPFITMMLVPFAVVSARDRCERFSGEAACRYSRGQAHYTLRRKAAKLHLGITNGLRPAFGESPPFVPAGLIGAKQPKAYPILFCVCLASGQIAGITGTEWNEICISSSAGW